jgi:hypothetical protein
LEGGAFAVNLISSSSSSNNPFLFDAYGFDGKGDFDGAFSYLIGLFLAGGCETGLTYLTGYFIDVSFFRLKDSSSYSSNKVVFFVFAGAETSCFLGGDSIFLAGFISYSSSSNKVFFFGC